MLLPGTRSLPTDFDCLDFFDEVIWISTSIAEASAPGSFAKARHARRVAPDPTPGDPRIGLALLHRRLLQAAADRALRSVLVLDGAALVLDDAPNVLANALAELLLRPWQVLHLGGRNGSDRFLLAEGCKSLAWCPNPSACGGYAVHHDAFPALLADIPSRFHPMREWIETRDNIHSALCRLPNSFAVSPGIVCLPADLPYQPLEFQHRFEA